MRTHSVTDFEKWRAAARACLADGVPPEAVTFGDARAGGLFAFPEQPLAATPATHTVPKAFFGLAEHVACYRDEGRWDLLYRVLWRVTHGEPRLLEVATDDDVHRLTNMRKHVRRDAHKMKAFVRFRRTIETNGDGTETEHFIAWHRPDHYIVKFVAPFFKKRFNGMRWTILTPDDSVGWDLENLTCGPGMPRSAAPAGDDLEDLWKTYYRSTFNPARVKVKAMQAEMPQKHWPTMPETVLIPELLEAADVRVAGMVAHVEGLATSAADYIEPRFGLAELKAAAAGCRACELCGPATQTVFGVGPADAEIMLVGEQPGDMEDRAGAPFVGPAGEVLDEALASAGLDRSRIYITNAVKHFKFIDRGKRRLHKKPDAREVAACKPWVEAEVDRIRPRTLVCLGATAAQSLIGRDFRITKQRGEFVGSDYCDRTLATWHPAAILRQPDGGRARAMTEELVGDLRTAVAEA